MPDPKAVYDCFLCQRAFQFGPHVYRGERIPEWDVMVCYSCRRSNSGGIVPAGHPHLVAHLQERGIEVRLNEKGRIEWPRTGPTTPML
jgi:hypothetical protein